MLSHGIARAVSWRSLSACQERGGPGWQIAVSYFIQIMTSSQERLEQLIATHQPPRLP